LHERVVQLFVCVSVVMVLVLHVLWSVARCLDVVSTSALVSVIEVCKLQLFVLKVLLKIIGKEFQKKLL